MNIVIFNSKGGVGKTSLSYSLAKDLDYGYITNDDSIVLKVYDKSKYITKHIPIVDECIYDLGGFITPFIEEILVKADKVLIPTINDYNSMVKAVELIEFVGADRVTIVATMIDTDKDFKEIEDVIQSRYKSIDVFRLNRTKAFKNGMVTSQSLKELYKENKLNTHIYKTIYKQYKKILKDCNNG